MRSIGVIHRNFIAMKQLLTELTRFLATPGNLPYP